MELPGEHGVRLRAFYGGADVCVTGGCGFIGGHLVEALLGLGTRVAVIDDLSNSGSEHIAGLIDAHPGRVRFVHASILDDRSLAEAVGGARVVFHLAAMGSVPRSIEEPGRSWLVNATGTLRVLEAARAAGAVRVVYSASSSAYGDTPTLPKVETMTPDPRSPYAAGKLAGEALCRAWGVSYGLSTACLRYFNVFGPRQPAGSAYAAVIPALAGAILGGRRPVIFGDGSQSRDFTPVRSAVLANLLAGASERDLLGEAMNIGTGQRTTVGELARLMGERLGRADLTPEFEPARAGDVLHSLADCSRARELIGYEPAVSLADGLEETLGWYRDRHAAAECGGGGGGACSAG